MVQLIGFLQFMLYRFSSQECLHCLYPSLISLISCSALSSPLAVLKAFFARLVFVYFEG